MISDLRLAAGRGAVPTGLARWITHASPRWSAGLTSVAPTARLPEDHLCNFS